MDITAELCTKWKGIIFRNVLMTLKQSFFLKNTWVVHAARADGSPKPGQYPFAFFPAYLSGKSCTTVTFWWLQAAHTAEHTEDLSKCTEPRKMTPTTTYVLSVCCLLPLDVIRAFIFLHLQVYSFSWLFKSILEKHNGITIFKVIWNYAQWEARNMRPEEHLKLLSYFWVLNINFSQKH